MLGYLNSCVEYGKCGSSNCKKEKQKSNWWKISLRKLINAFLQHYYLSRSFSWIGRGFILWLQSLKMAVEQTASHYVGYNICFNFFSGYGKILLCTAWMCMFACANKMRKKWTGKDITSRECWRYMQNGFTWRQNCGSCGHIFQVYFWTNVCVWIFISCMTISLTFVCVHISHGNML